MRVCDMVREWLRLIVKNRSCARLSIDRQLDLYHEAVGKIQAIYTTRPQVEGLIRHQVRSPDAR